MANITDRTNTIQHNALVIVLRYFIVANIIMGVGIMGVVGVGLGAAAINGITETVEVHR